MTKTRWSITTFMLGLIVGGSLMAAAVQNNDTRDDKPGVTGIGGVFFKAENPEQLRAWYKQHLHIDTGGPGVNFFWREREDPDSIGMTVWSLFPRNTKYFGPGDQEFMINYRVRNLDALLESLQKQGIQQVRASESYEYGKFAWISDGEGNQIELWEPVNISADEFAKRSQPGSAQ